MKKKFIGIALACCICLSGVSLTACGEDTVNVPYDDMIHEDGSYDENLFYRNDCDILAPDSQVLKITEGEEAGYYYLYATNCMTVYRSKDLCHWENMSRKVGYNAYTLAENDFGDGNAYCWWAPEVLYNDEDEMYYMYFSMEPRNGTGLNPAIICAKSENPYGPFVNVRPAPSGNPQPSDPDATWQEKLTYGNENYFFDMETLSAVLREKYPERFGENYKYVSAIDPHPFTDPAADPQTGEHKKYLYWTSLGTYTDEGGSSAIFVMEMEDWITPKYDTVKRLTTAGYTTVDGEDRCDCETDSNWINEGPFVYPRKQADGSYQYYLTLSVNASTDKTYSVIQAIGDSPMGPFTKLQKADGGILIGTDNQSWDHISGPGHHSFVENDGELYILYHQHMDVVLAGDDRAVSVDDVKLTKNSQGQEVLYVNGPTRESVQLLPEFASEYKNIAPEATVTSSDKQDASILNDGLVSLYSYIEYVKEFKTEKKVTITLSFEDYREITGVMIYNSKNYDTAFDKITSVKIYFKDGEETHTGLLKDISFDMEKYSYQGGMRPGGAAIAVFRPTLINKIEVTVSVPEKRAIDQDDDGYYIYQSAVAFSEIKVIGK